MNHVKCGRCVRCGREYPAVPNLTNCECGGILDIIYDYDQIKTVLTRETLKNRTERSMWRYRELLPVEPETPAPPLRVGWSPLYKADRLAKELGIAKLWVKDDGQNPTASLKDRASAMAVAKAQEAGAHVIACSSTGNAASSLAGNAAAAGLQTFIFVPSRAPKGKVAQLMTFGATVISVQGSYEDTFELSKQAIDRYADLVRRVCMIHLKNHADTEDIFQTVFLKYVTGTTEFESEEHEKAWFIRVTINACKDLLRSFFRSRTVSLDDLLEQPDQVPEDHREVLEAVLALPDKYRDVVYLHYYEGYTAPEIGTILHKNPNTVYTLLTRARDELRKMLGGEDFE